MAGTDTNVLVRYIVDDDPEQIAAVDALMAKVRADEAALFVPLTVALELEWVLRSRYGYTKEQILVVYSTLLATWELEFHCEEVVEHGLELYRTGAADFADCLHAAICVDAKQQPLLTFDALAARVDDIERLTTAGQHPR